MGARGDASRGQIAWERMKKNEPSSTASTWPIHNNISCQDKSAWIPLSIWTRKQDRPRHLNCMHTQLVLIIDYLFLELFPRSALRVFILANTYRPLTQSQSKAKDLALFFTATTWRGLLKFLFLTLGSMRHPFLVSQPWVSGDLIYIFNNLQLATNLTFWAAIRPRHISSTYGLLLSRGFFNLRFFFRFLLLIPICYQMLRYLFLSTSRRATYGRASGRWASDNEKKITH